MFVGDFCWLVCLLVSVVMWLCDACDCFGLIALYCRATDEFGWVCVLCCVWLWVGLCVFRLRLGSDCGFDRWLPTFCRRAGLVWVLCCAGLSVVCFSGVGRILLIACCVLV